MHAMPSPSTSPLAARRWARLRVPGLVFSAGPPLTAALVLALTLLGPADSTETIAEVVSWRTTLEGLAFGTLLAVMVLGWYTPRLAALATALSVLPVFGPGTDVVSRNLWWVWLAILLLDLVLRHAQASIERPRSTPPVDEAPADLEVEDSFSWERRIVTIGLLVGALVVSALWIDRRETFIALDARAEASTGVVVETITLDDVVEVEIDGRVHEFWVADASIYQVGQEVPVMIDPTGEERPYGLGNADPDDWLLLTVLAGILLALGIVTGGTQRHRAKQLRRLLSDRRSTGWEVDVLPDGPDLLVFAVGDHRRPLAALPRFDVVHDALDDSWDEEESWDGSVADLTFTRATVHGLDSDGGPTVVMDSDGTVMVSLRPARDPWTLARLLVHLREAVAIVVARSRGRRGGESRDRSGDSRRPSFLYRLLPAVLPLAAAAPLLVFVAARWMYADPAEAPGPVLALTSGLGLGFGLAIVVATARPPLSARAGSVRLRSPGWTLIVPTSLVDGVGRGEDWISLDVTGRGEPFVVHDDRRWGRLDAMLDELEAARRAGIPRAGAKVRRRPGAAPVLGALTAIATAAGAWAGSVGSLPWV